jgi:hypothetical protein
MSAKGFSREFKLAAILLWAAGLDPFDVDAEAEPPDGQTGQTEQGVRAGERDAVVSANGPWSAALLSYCFPKADMFRCAPLEEAICCRTSIAQYSGFFCY